MSTARVVLATRNRHKLDELRAILLATGVVSDVSGLVAVADLGGAMDPGEVVESGVTFHQNALLKAHAVAAASGLPALADDSGICVPVMGGAPGIFSARWAGHGRGDEANVDLLLDQLQDVPDEHRGAWFTCVAVLAWPDGREHTAEGRMTGRLIREPRGGGGFGYDPIFVPDGQTRTCAELDPSEKNAISHRTRALVALAPAIADVL